MIHHIFSKHQLVYINVIINQLYKVAKPLTYTPNIPKLCNLSFSFMLKKTIISWTLNQDVFSSAQSILRS